ncbi:MAG: MotA/TolQ/ExbB proton channel family protein [Fibromonadaceae bacterium]|jgi:biopolymer transport protein ExbB|nr:MotA/TolQ/ExbB proton channel family protein [Fibromonadaceae bacterium]
MLTAVAFGQVDLVQQQAEINSARADLEEARKARDFAVAKRWEEKAKQNEEREKIDSELENRREKAETVLAERSRLFEELRIARDALNFANEDAEKARISFTSVFPEQSRLQELETVNKGATPFAIPEISLSKDSPLQAAESLFSVVKKNIEHNAEIEVNDSLVRLGGLGTAKAETIENSVMLVHVDPLLNSGSLTEIINRKEQTLSEKFWKLMEDGGILMYPIVAMLIIALILIAERIFVLILNGKRYEVKLKETILDQEVKTREEAEKKTEALFGKIVPHLENRLPIISVLGTTAPLVGLLGTVMGMIELFNVITIHGTADPKLLAGGISIALVTTKAGLSVAIPVHLLHTWVSGRVEKKISKMDFSAMTLINERFKL